MKQQKEMSGTKTVVKIQVQKLKKIKHESYRNMPYAFRKMSDGLSKKFSHVISVEVTDIDNKDKLAYVIRKHFGFGKFNVLFYNLYTKSSNYNPRFKCLVQRGKECSVKDKCKLWKRHQKGWACMKNRKFRPNWSRRARLTIFPRDLYGDIDFGYKWDRKGDLMYYFRKWFWKEGRR